MSIARLDNYRKTDLTLVADVPATADAATTTPNLTVVPAETVARGFALYVGLDEATATAAGTSLADVVNALRKTLSELVPAAAQETFAAVALAPANAGGKSVDIVRTALRDPRALDQLVAKSTEDQPAKGIVVDLSRHKVFADGENAELTFTEFELLRYLIENEGETISRQELVDVVWQDGEEAAPNERTIDVHIRRLRSKIAGYEDIVRTIRGGGYRFDKHPDVLIEG